MKVTQVVKEAITESNTSRAFRFGNDGICTNCRKTYVTKEE